MSAEVRRALPVAVAAGLAAAGWLLFDLGRDHLPVWLRLLVAGGVLTLGPGAGLTGPLLKPLPWLPRIALGLSFGLAFAPLLAHALGSFGLLAVYPYVASALVGGVCMYWAVRAEPRRPPAFRVAPVVVVLLAVVMGTVAFAHRLSEAPGATTVYGEYDSYDLTYYAGIAAELSHTIPPASPFYSGRMLNHAFYPHVVLALTHRFGDVPVLDLYFRYAWPAFLVLTMVVCFVFMESISTPFAAVVSAVLFGAGSNLAYLAAWWLDRPIWDEVIWSHNFQGAGAEVLFYGNWTPALATMFAVLYGVHAGSRRAGRGWSAAAGVALATTVLAKPWIFASVMAALVVVAFAARRDRVVVRHLLVVLAVGAVIAAPLLYRTMTLFDDSQVTFRPAFFPIPLVMAERIGLRGWFLGRAAALGLTGSLQTGVAAMLAAPLFLVGSLGFRLAGLREWWRGVRHPARQDAVWAVMAWTALAALVASTVIASVPYHETTQIHQLALFVLVPFVGRALAGVRRPAARLAAAAGVVAGAAPCTVQYLHRKWRDREHPLVQVSAAERTLASLLRSTDPERTVLLHDRPNEPSLLSVLSARRSVLSWAGYVRGAERRREDVDAFFAAPDAARATEILRTYRPTHVVEYEGRDRINPEVRARLELASRTGGVALYRVLPGLVARP